MKKLSVLSLLAFLLTFASFTIFSHNVARADEYYSVTAPNGGEAITTGQHVSIQWTNNTAKGTHISLVDDRNNEYYIGVTDRWGRFFNWTARRGDVFSTSPSNRFKIKVRPPSNDGGPGLDLSDDYFTITDPDTAVTLTGISPASAVIGTNMTITGSNMSIADAYDRFSNPVALYDNTIHFTSPNFTKTLPYYGISSRGVLSFPLPNDLLAGAYKVKVQKGNLMSNELDLRVYTPPSINFTINNTANSINVPPGGSLSLKWNTERAISCRNTSNTNTSFDRSWTASAVATTSGSANFLAPTTVGTYYYSINCTGEFQNTNVATSTIKVYVGPTSITISPSGSDLLFNKTTTSFSYIKPYNALSSDIYFLCPTGVTVNGFDYLYGDRCNKTLDLTNWTYSPKFTFTNYTNSIQKVAVRYRVSTSDVAIPIRETTIQISVLPELPQCISTDIFTGSTGLEVYKLQYDLLTKGFLATSSIVGTFGPLTQAAVRAYQLSKGISPVTGFVDANTRTALNRDNNCTQPVPPTTVVQALRLRPASTTPLAQITTALSGTSEDLELLRADINPTIPGIVKDVRVRINRSAGSSAVVQSVKLYEGSTLIGTTALVNGIAQFNNVDIDIEADKSRVFSVKLHVRNATTSPSVFTASILNTDITAHNDRGGVIPVTGTATGNAIDIRTATALWSLVSTDIETTYVADEVGEADRVTASIVLRVIPIGTDMLKPRETDFGVVFNFLETAPITPESLSVTTDTTSNTYTLLEGQPYTVTVTGTISGHQTARNGYVNMMITHIDSMVEGGTQRITGTSTAQFRTENQEIHIIKSIPAIVTPSPVTTYSCYNFTFNFGYGTSGAHVTALQKYLISKGHLSARATGYFGTATQNAVIALQRAAFIAPASGYVGTLTRYYLNNGCGYVTPVTTPTPTPQPSATVVPTATPTASPRVTATPTPTTTSTPRPTTTSTPRPTTSATPTYSSTPTYSPTYTSTPTPTPTPTPTATQTSSPTSTPSPSASPSTSPSATTSSSPSSSPSSTSSGSPSPSGTVSATTEASFTASLQTFGRFLDSILR
jgi:hypothetical protein